MIGVEREGERESSTVSWPSPGLMLIRFDLDRGRERGRERELDGQLAQFRVDAD